LTAIKDRQFIKPSFNASVVFGPAAPDAHGTLSISINALTTSLSFVVRKWTTGGMQQENFFGRSKILPVYTVGFGRLEGWEAPLAAGEAMVTQQVANMTGL